MHLNYLPATSQRSKTIALSFFVGLFCFQIFFPQSALADHDCISYRYRAEITKVQGEGTITADIDLGFHTWRKDSKLRLYGIEIPSLRGVEKPYGIQSRDALRDRILDKKVIICTIKTSKTDNTERRGRQGHFVVKLYLDGKNINDWLVKQGFAKYRDY